MASKYFLTDKLSIRSLSRKIIENSENDDRALPTPDIPWCHIDVKPIFLSNAFMTTPILGFKQNEYTSTFHSAIKKRPHLEEMSLQFDHV